MKDVFDPINHGFIIAALIGFLVLLVTSISLAAPDVLQQEQGNQLSVVRLPVIGVVMRLIGIGEVPVLFLLGIYLFIIGIVGWSGNLFCLFVLGFYPSEGLFWWVIRLMGILIAWVFTLVVRKLRKLLKTKTVDLIPERLIGVRGEIVKVGQDGIFEISVYDEIGRFSLQVGCVLWENALETDLKVGDKVYIVDLLSSRYYAVVKFDGPDQLKAMSRN